MLYKTLISAIHYLRKAEQSILTVLDILDLEDWNCFWGKLSKHKGNLKAPGRKRLGMFHTLSLILKQLGVKAAYHIDFDHIDFQHGG